MNGRKTAAILCGLLVAVGLILATLFLHWLLFQDREIVPGVIERPLGPCVLDWFSRRGDLVLACPRTDLIRLWPLPIFSPWSEDPGYELQVGLPCVSGRSPVRFTELR